MFWNAFARALASSFDPDVGGGDGGGRAKFENLLAPVDASSFDPAVGGGGGGGRAKFEYLLPPVEEGGLYAPYAPYALYRCDGWGGGAAGRDGLVPSRGRGPPGKLLGPAFRPHSGALL
jgi:hypothetical protein